MDELLHVEHTFYAQGYTAGLPHGHLHGLIEGRELGRDNAWTLWEEIGACEGTATLWSTILATTAPGTQPPRAAASLDAVLALARAFPLDNHSNVEGGANAPMDITAQLTALRNKYRTACAALGIRPRMAVSTAGDGDHTLRSIGSTV